MRTKRKAQKAVRTTRSSKAMSLLNEIVSEPMTFGNILRTIRETDDLSQAESAKRIGVTRSHVCDIEKGRKLVSAERAARFAEALGYSRTLFVQLALQDQVREAGLDMNVKIGAA